MISYEELCAALERYRANHGAAEPQADMPTGQTAMPPVQEHEELTSVGVEPIYDTGSNELDIGDVLSDEEVSKN